MNKPGLYTTEFWIAVTTQILAFLAISGVIKPTDRQLLLDNVTQAITALGVLAASAHVVANYIRSRTTIKVNQDL